MGNYLKVTKRQHVLSLLALGWTYRRIQTETGVRRETVARYDRLRRANAAKVFAGSSLPDRAIAVPYRDAIQEKLDRGLSLQRMWQDLVEEYAWRGPRPRRSMSPETKQSGCMTWGRTDMAPSDLGRALGQRCRLPTARRSCSQTPAIRPSPRPVCCPFWEPIFNR